MSTERRYIVVGAGAVGVTIAAELQHVGRTVVIVARGAQLAALRSGTLRYARPDGTRQLSLPTAAGPDEVVLRPRDILILTTKTQDADLALADWAWGPVESGDGALPRPAAAAIPVATVQNGLDAERSALRRFETVFGAVLWVAAGYVAPGEVAVPSESAVGMAWLGAYPHGAHPVLESVAADLTASGWVTRVVPDIQRYKAAKLTASATFALSALYQPGTLRTEAERLVRDEAREILAASGQDLADLSADAAAGLPPRRREAISGPQYGGNSTWQSLTRASSVETDFINGEVVLAARLLGRSAPANAAIAARVHHALRDGTSPGSLDDKDLLATLPKLAEQPGQTDQTTPTEQAVPTEQVRAEPDVLVDAATLRRLLDGPAPPAVLDVRWALGDPHGRDHYLAGHILGAVYADLDTALAAPPTPAGGRHPLPDVADLQEAARAWGLSDGTTVVVYDNSGGLAAARAWWLLRWAGVSVVRILDGTLAAWQAAGYELETGEHKPAPGNVTLSAGHLPVLTADDAAALTRDGVLLDARAGERYRGEVEPVDPRAGHIPGAVSAPTAANINADGTFAAPEALRARFAALGVHPGTGTTVGVYCGSGVTAAHEIAALRIAGVDAALYPGSWSAWSADPARPVATGPQPG
jgi:thiosulfate/3-mercaptopyruvate sulfurtransferase